ncbi:MAG TPA: sensor histidine kinase [Gaiellaceae bacterium]
MNIAEPACNDAAVRPGTPRTTQAAKTFVYLLTAIPLGAIGFATLVAGWVVVSVLAITPLVVPALVAFRAAVGGIARLEGRVANALLGTRTAPPMRSAGPKGYWRRIPAILGDGAFWKQQVFLLQRYVVGVAFAVGEASLLAGSLGYLTQPIWYRWADSGYGSWRVDSLGRAFIFFPAGLVGLPLALVLLRPLTAYSRSLAVGLLGGEGPAYPDSRSPVAKARRLRALEWHALAVVLVNALTIVIWASTTPGRYFWPMWTLLPLGVALAVHAWTVYVGAKRQSFPHAFAIHAGVSAGVLLLLVLIWAVTSRGYFWPLWPMLAFAIVLLVHLAIDRRFREQNERIEQLETTRAGAVDQQDAELRRIERDLHDGAQAQLVALGMSIGMAEQKLASDPAGAQRLLADARRGAREALEELRSLARGIHPPVLADRGLEAAIAALADRTPLTVHVEVDVDRRPPAPVETAAYYVVAESLANVGKHANAERVDIAVRRRGDELSIEITDDGTGGANAAGNGLLGLRRRVEALDGTFRVESPKGGPTVVRAVMPCAS